MQLYCHRTQIKTVLWSQRELTALHLAPSYVAPRTLRQKPNIEAGSWERVTKRDQISDANGKQLGTRDREADYGDHPKTDWRALDLYRSICEQTGDYGGTYEIWGNTENYGAHRRLWKHK